MNPGEPSRLRSLVGPRRLLVGAGLGLFLVGLYVLRADPRELLPNREGLRVAGEFLRAALHPAMDYEAADLPASAPAFGVKVGTALAVTLRYAVVAMSLALAGGIVFGFLGSRAWWPDRPGPLRRFLLEAMRFVVRTVATAARSVHELLWAVLFLTAVGTSPLAAVLAIALPYAGVLAKVFAELLDEQNDSAARVMRAAGSGTFAAFLAGVLIRGLPDLVTYAFYRLECAVRSSAVLGFLGIPTLGYHLATAYEDGHYREIWTYLYVLIVAVAVIDQWGALVRKRMSRPRPARRAGTAGDAVGTLHRMRPRSPLLKLTLVVGVGVVAAAWALEERWSSDLPAAQRQQNLERFVARVVPHPVSQSGDWADAGPWLRERLWPGGVDGLRRTFHIGTNAMMLAGVLGLLAIPIAARTLAGRDPLGVPGGNSRYPAARAAGGWLVRFVALVFRSVPEYILAFLLLQIFGPTVWPLILALMIHNSGIFLRLSTEVVDNRQGRAGEVMLAAGARRGAVFSGALLPLCFNRFVLLLFYRWETCIREATVLGMLGVASLGYLIDDAKSRLYYDDMALYVLLGAGLVFAGDLASDLVRHRLRAREGLGS